MKLRVVGGLVMIGCCQQEMFATTCTVPPCELLRADSALFVGTVIEIGPDNGDELRTHDVRLHVDQVFAGLPEDTREASLTIEGSWLEIGRSYLIDAVRGNDKKLYPTICGASGEITDGSIASILEYLRKQSKANTSLRIFVSERGERVARQEVVISGIAGKFRRSTGADGVVTFDAISPGKYHVTVLRRHYHVEESSTSDQNVEVLPGACLSSGLELEAEGEVSGVVVDHDGVSVEGLELELVAVESRFQTMPLKFEPRADTGKDGSFRFESVSPGRYLLGSHLTSWTRSSIPRTYYPGQRTQDGAVPIEVKLGESVDKLLFTLPDFGERRNIEVCVVDENGKPASSVEVGTDLLRAGDDFAALGRELVTDETGCVRTSGYSRAEYALRASISAPGPNSAELRASNTFVVQPGDAPVRVVLQLLRP